MNKGFKVLKWANIGFGALMILGGLLTCQWQALLGGLYFIIFGSLIVPMISKLFEKIG